VLLAASWRGCVLCFTSPGEIYFGNKRALPSVIMRLGAWRTLFERFADKGQPGASMKRIICCLDGTWNDSTGGVLTNVAKLQRAIPTLDRSGVAQASYYIPGIASRPGESAQFLKGAFGYGVSARIRAAYEQIGASYEFGDELYLFGFSRG